MHNALIAYASPVFFILMFFEYWWSRREGRIVHEFSDSLTSIGCGIFTVTLELFAKAGLLVLFALVSAHGLWQWSSGSWVTWVVFFLLLDFVYYWAHRWSHELNILWAGHVPHHQSEEYNLTTALRQGAFQDISHWPLYSGLAVLGCPVEVFILLLTFSKFYQFWIHTRLIGKLPLIEGVLNTPSAHRVHHGINDPYIDRNHGGTLMIWDRLFGTYIEEQEEVVFGVRKAFRARNPVTAHVDWLVTMWRDAELSGQWQDRFRIWFKPTGWRPDRTCEINPRPPFSLAGFQRYVPVLSVSQKQQGVFWFVLAIAFNSAMMLGFGKLTWGQQGLLAMSVTATLWQMSRVFLVPSAQ